MVSSFAKIVFISFLLSFNVSSQTFKIDTVFYAVKSKHQNFLTPKLVHDLGAFIIDVELISFKLIGDSICLEYRLFDTDEKFVGNIIYDVDISLNLYKLEKILCRKKVKYKILDRKLNVGLLSKPIETFIKNDDVIYLGFECRNYEIRICRIIKE